MHDKWLESSHWVLGESSSNDSIQYGVLLGMEEFRWATLPPMHPSH